MIYKIVNGFILGLALTLMVDFLVFIGLKLHYFDALKITEYFNIYFFDHQSFVLLGISALFFGIGVLYTPFAKLFWWGYLVFLGVSSLALMEPVGRSLGEAFFLQENQQFQVGNVRFVGDLLYEGRHAIYVKRPEIEHTIRIVKSDVRWGL